MNSRINFTQFAWGLAIALWGIFALGTWVWATNYELTAKTERPSEIPNPWPTNSQLIPSVDRPTLLFFLHPQCPCSRASVHELERMLTGSGLTPEQLPTLIVVPFSPQKPTTDWMNSSTLGTAMTLPLAELFWDVDGVESARFAAATSGAVRLYAPEGRLLFAGGVTASRGHEGDNHGRQLLWQQLVEPSATLPECMPVFGCQIRNDVN